MKSKNLTRSAFIAGALCAFTSVVVFAQTGYFREPGLGKDVLTFVSEGDIWSVNPDGGVATRLTTHPARESTPQVSPDGKMLAFVARYEGPSEVYVMPVVGGAPRRLTFDGATRSSVVGWTPDNRVLYATSRYSGLPRMRLYSLDATTGVRQPLPLDDAEAGCYVGSSFVFTRKGSWSDNVKNYQGGLAKSLWRFDGKAEAVPLTGDYAGMSWNPMCTADRVYFLSDRDGTTNVWSMNLSGRDLKQHTRHKGDKEFDIRSASLAGSRIVYQMGADLYRLDLADGQSNRLTITLRSDFDQTRSRWIKNPLNFVTDAAVSPNGDRVALSLRGQLLVLPVGNGGRRVEVTRDAKSRVRVAHFAPDGKSIFALTTQSGEQELASFVANGASAMKPITRDGNAIRDTVLPAPDGKQVLLVERSGRTSIVDSATGTVSVVDDRKGVYPEGFAWSPDSRWIAYAADAGNDFGQLTVFDTVSKARQVITSDRYNASSPTWSADGNFLFFLSDRNLQTVVPSPWGTRAPMPFFDKQLRIYAYALNSKARWPFQVGDELITPTPATASPTPATPAPATPTPVPAPAPAIPPPAPSPTPPLPKRPSPTPQSMSATTPVSSGVEAKEAPASGATASGTRAASLKAVVIDFAGIRDRLYEVPLPAGNYSRLGSDGKRLYFLASDAVVEPKRRLMTLAIDDTHPKAEVFSEDVSSYELSHDLKKVLLQRRSVGPLGRSLELFVFDAAAKAPTAPEQLGKARVDMSGLTFELDPRDEWRQIFDDAWRLHRDTYYDPNLRGVDWKALRAKFAPLVERISERSELDDILAQMIAELRLLHSQVGGADLRTGSDTIDVAALGIDVVPVADGLKITRHYSGDPELIEERSPLTRAESRVEVGEIITAVNGQSVKSANDLARELRNRGNRQVLLAIRRAGSGLARQVIAVPNTAARDAQLRYRAWEHERRGRVERDGDGKLGYLHVQAMGATDMAQFTREFFPLVNRDGLIIDLRGNNGGNIDSWIVTLLQRRAWAFWTNRSTREPYPNQQRAFRGHIVALIDGNTYSDGETAAEGLRRLGIATLIGSRTAGAGVWLSDRNALADNGIARAAESPYFDLQGRWFVEGRGVTPDIDVDNLPFATFNDDDAQLSAAIKFLRDKIAKEPIPAPRVPAFPALAK